MHTAIIIAAIVFVIAVIVLVYFVLANKPKTVVSGTGVSIAPGASATIVAPPRAIMGKTVTIHRKSGTGGISLSEVILRDPNGKRIVPSSATSSSKYSMDGKFDPDKLIDGDFGTSARTADPPGPGEVPIITLDFGADVAIGTIEVATGGSPVTGLAIQVTDSSGRRTFGRTITADRPYFAMAPAGAALPHPPIPMFTGGKLESFSVKDVYGRFVQATAIPRVFDKNGMRLNAVNITATKGAAPVYTVDLGSNKGIGRINLAGRGGEHSVVVKSARGDVTYTAAVKKN